MRFVPLVLALSLVTPLAVPAQTNAPDALGRYRSGLEKDPSNGFYRYATIQTARRLGVEPPSSAVDSAPVDRWRRQLYEMTTGAWAVQESLQLDRLLQNGDVPEAAPSIPVASIEGVATPSIPFEKLMAGRTPTIEWLARAAPAEWYYAHFPKVSAMRRVADASDRWGSHLLASYSITGRDSRVKPRLERQLLLRATPEFDTLYDLVIDEVAVVGSDPFLREGSDVTVIFSVKNAMLLAAHLEKNRRDAVASADRVSISQERYRDWVVDGVASADRSVSSYASIRGGLAVVSNSLTALRHVADCVDRVTPAMADSPDFKFMRTVTPYAPADEDGFLFLSDEFVRRVVGPTLKIGEARRLRCATSLQSIGYSALMYRTENGRPPATIDELVESKYLDKTELRCPDGGRYSLDGDVAVCSIHRRQGALTPNLELQVDKVTKDEADAYAGFREGYKSYWRRYIDPVGIRIQARNGLDIRANILPVVENSPYSQMIEAIGTAPVSLARPQLKSAIATLDLKLPKPPPPANETARETQQVFGIDAELLFGKALGDSVSIQVADGNPLFSTDLGGLLDAGGFGPLDEWFFLTPFIAAITLPTAVVAQIQDRSALEKALDQLRSMVRREGKRPSEWMRLSDYQVVQGGARTLEAITVQFLFLKWRVFYTISGDRFLIATSPELIEELAAAPKSGDERAAMRMELAPSRWSRLAPSMAMSYAEDSRETCLKNLSWLEVLREGFKKEPYELEPQSLALFGTAFQCPDGGRYQSTGTSVSCSVHGTVDSPRQGPRPQTGSAAAYILDAVGRIEATLTFTADGLSTHIVVEPSTTAETVIKP